MELIKLITIKNIKLHNLLQFSFKLTIFILAVYFIYSKLYALDGFQKIEFGKRTSLYIIIVIALSTVNWFFESLKFSTLLRKRYTLSKIIASVFAGNATSIITPNRLGTFIGRKMVLKDSNYPEVITVTSIGNIAQLSVTLLFGTIGIGLGLSMIDFFYEIPLYIIILVLGINFLLLFASLNIYFNPKRFLKFIGRWRLLKKYIDLAEQNLQLVRSDQYKVYFYSLLRYIIFIVQFYLLFKVVNISIPLTTTISFVGVLYVLVSFVPSVFMGNLGIKEAVAIMLLGGTYQMSSVFFVSLMIWIVNVALSALVGSIILLIKR